MKGKKCRWSCRTLRTGRTGTSWKTNAKALIQEAIDALPPKYHRVIVLRHQQEKSYEEIAQELDLPLGTVKAHIFRARELLNKYLRSQRHLL